MIDKAKLFILAIDDVEKSITTADYLYHNYAPKPLVRARNRQHYYRLREVGVTHIWRETICHSICHYIVK